MTDSICHKTNITINDSDDFDVWAYVECYRGLQRQPLYMALPITIINCFIFVTGFLGNICVCIVIAKHSSLHTATNYYLFNLAISDLLLLVFGKYMHTLLSFNDIPLLRFFGLNNLRNDYNFRPVNNALLR